MNTFQQAIEPRLGFLPPRFHVPAWSAEAGWSAVAPVVPLTDLAGATPTNRRLTVRLAWTAEALLLRAECRGEAAALKPDQAPDDDRFWMQDHVELRLVHADGGTLQVIAVPDGRCWDSRKERTIPGRLSCAGTVRPKGWRLEVRLAREALGLEPLGPGVTLRGLVAAARWTAGDTPDLVACTAVELGFQQDERFAEFALCSRSRPDCGVAAVGPTAAEETRVGPTRATEGDAPRAEARHLALPLLTAVACPDSRTVRLTLRAPQAAGFSGHLAVRWERADGESGSHRQPLALPPGGKTVVTAPWPREPRRFTRLHVAVEDVAGRHELAAPSLRAGLPPLPEPGGPLAHPCLWFDAAGLAEFRRKAASAFFQPNAAELALRPDDLDDGHLPPPGERPSLLFDAGSMAWIRVCRETLLRDGDGNRRPAAARIWSLLAEQAREAVRAIATGPAAETPERVAVLVAAFNGLLQRSDLADGGAFERVGMVAEGRKLLARPVSELAPRELLKRNRILLQSAIECCHNYGMDMVGRAGGYLAKWLLSGDRRLIELATRTAAAAADIVIPDATFHLHEGNVSPLLALSYDAFHPELTDEQRAVWRRLLTLLLDHYLDSARRRAWTVSAVPNANPVANAGAGYLALALWNEEPEKAREALRWVRHYIWNWLDYCSGRDGGNTEGCQYWQYGTESWLRFAALYERFFGRDDGMLDHPALRHGMNMIRVALCNDGALHGINDTIPVPCGIEMAWLWAGRYGDRFALWYGDHARRWYAAEAAAGRATPYRVSPVWGILFRPDLPEAGEQPEPLPEAFALRGIEYGILRSGPEWNCRWTAGLKGSRPPYSHHNQADTGAFFADLRGERLLIDPGYYKPAPTDHCLPLIGGRGPAFPSGFAGAIVACEQQGVLRHLAVDATPAYGGTAQRVVRHLVMVGEEGLVLVDDIDTERPVTAQYQCGGVTEAAPDGRRVTIAGERARLRLELVTHAGARFDLKPERTLHDVHWGYHFARCRHFPVTADYSVDAGDPLVTVLLDTTEGDCALCRIERPHAGCLVVRLPSGRAVRFTRLSAGWAPDLEEMA